MSNNQNDNNLLSFLKNQSLFNGSPTRKMSSRSRDRKSERNRSPGANQQYQGQQGNYNYNVSYNGNAPNNYNDNNRVVNTSYQTNTNYQGGQVSGGIPGGNYQTTTTTTYGGNGGNLQGNTQMGGNFNSSIQGGQMRNSYEANTTTFNTNDAIQTGLLSTAVAVANEKTYASSFESARVETAQRLEGLAQKVKNEINNLNYKLEMFNSSMISVVTQEYNEIKERIYQVVEETFRNSEGYISEYMKTQEMKFAE